MLSWLFSKQPSTYRVIYLEVAPNVAHSVVWPKSFAALQNIIRNLTGIYHSQLFFQDASYATSNLLMWVKDEETFRALIPCHRNLQGVEVYYVRIEWHTSAQAWKQS